MRSASTTPEQDDPNDPLACAPLAGIRLEASRVEVRLTRAAVKARLFRRTAEATRIGRFIVLERIGMGGMGIVYAAYDPQLDRRVALKVMRDDVVRSRRSAQQQQLLREAQAMAKLSHPHVVAVYDAGTVDEQVFVAMEFVESRTLRAWMRDEHSPAEILRVFTEAGRGLAGAHAAGLVHRDFKPENVLVPGEGAVRVTDFGLARASVGEAHAVPGARSREAGGIKTVLTAGIAGTPAYMSPQQMRGEPIDARADQWAFCVALYEALVGHRPFDDAALAKLTDGTAVAIPPLPEAFAIAPEVRAAIERGLAYDPADRFADMTALLARLRPRTRSRRAYVVGAAAVAGLVGVVVWRSFAHETCPRATHRFEGIWDVATRARAAESIIAANPSIGADTWRRVAPIVDTYVDEWLDVRQSSCRAADDGELSAELFDARMACLDARHTELAALSATFARTDIDVVANAIESAVRLTPLDACTDPRILRGLTPPPPPEHLRAASDRIRGQVEHARALRRAGKAEEARTASEAAVAAAVSLDESTALVEAWLERGRVRAELADREGAAADFDAVIERGAPAGNLVDVAAASVALVEVVGVDMARHEAALDLARMASVAVALGGDERLLRAQLNLARGRVLYVAGRAEDGLEATRQGLEHLASPDASPIERLERAAALRLLAKLTFARDEPERTTALATEALAIFEDLLGPRHPEVATTLAHLAAASLRLSRVELAKQQFERAARIQRDVYGDQHPSYGRTVANLGSAIRAAGDLHGALESYRTAVAILERSLGADDPRVASLWINIGGVEADLGRALAAEAAYRSGLRSLTVSAGERHPQTALALANIGRLELGRGEIEAAKESLRRALEIREEVLGAEHIETARSRLAWGDMLAESGDDATAIGHYRDAIATFVRVQAPPGEIADARVLLTQTLARLGQDAAAREQLALARPDLTPSAADALAAWCEGATVCESLAPRSRPPR